MGIYQPRRTFADPSSSQAGFPAPGAGAQTTGEPFAQTKVRSTTPWEPKRPTKGFRSWFKPSSPIGGQQGYPAPESAAQHRPPGSMPNDPPVWGGVYMNYTPYFDRGAAAYVPNYGKVLVNPIGAGIVALNRPQASYGGAAQYINGALWWTNQVVPTSVNLQGLTDPQELAAIFDQLQVQAVVRTTG